MNSKKGLSITLWILIINIVFFLFVTIFSYNNEQFWNYIALKPSAIFQLKYLWTFITSMFMHAGILHLAVNMLSLVFLGGFVEKVIGRKRFLWFYLASGIFAGLFFVFLEYLFGKSPDVMAVGASGALFALAGLIAILTPKLPVYILFIPIAMPMWIASFIMLGALWLISLSTGMPIGNTAHLGGLLAGLIYGFYLRKKYKRKVKLLNRYLGLK